MKTLTKFFILTICIAAVYQNAYSTAFTHLAPKSFPQKQHLDINEQYEAFLYKKCFGEKEKAFIIELKSLHDYAKTSPSENDLKERINNFAVTMTKALLLSSNHLNMSLFSHVETYFLTSLKEENINATYTEYLKRILYTIGTQGTALFDHDATQNDEKLIYRQTEPDRLTILDKVILQKTDPHTKSIVFYDVGASYGSTTLDTHNMLKENFPSADIRVMPADLNMDHYILYDLKNKKRIFINGIGQVREIYSLDVEKHKTPLTNTKHAEDQYNPIIKSLKKQINNKNRFAGNDNYVLEKVVLLDPQLKSIKNTKPLQYNAKHALDDQLPKANIIRIANLLQYFASNKVKAKILNNLLTKLKDGGMLLFNYEEVTEDSKYLFALKKQGTHVEILMIDNNDIQTSFLSKLFGNKKNYLDLRQLKNALSFIGYTYTEVEEFDSELATRTYLNTAA